MISEYIRKIEQLREREAELEGELARAIRAQRDYADALLRIRARLVELEGEPQPPAAKCQVWHSGAGLPCSVMEDGHDGPHRARYGPPAEPRELRWTNEQMAEWRGVPFATAGAA